MSDLKEIKDNIIVLSSENYKEKDKLIVFFGLNLGRRNAVVKGVRGENAKLKFLKEPFNFSEVIFFERGEFLTVKTASCTETFFDIATDYDKFEAGATVLETLKTFDAEGSSSKKVFKMAISALKNIAFSCDILPVITSLKFILDIIETGGFGKVNHCETCGKLIDETGHFTIDGNLVCKKCNPEISKKYSRITIEILNDIEKTDYDNLSFIKPTGEEFVPLKKLIRDVYHSKIGYDLKTLK